ncbi:transcription initiation factor IIB family protein [Stetteria hydrogenophila]
MAEAVDAKGSGGGSENPTPGAPGLDEFVEIILDRGRRIGITKDGRSIVLEDQVIDAGPEWRTGGDGERSANRIRASGRYTYRYHDASTAEVTLARRGGTRLPRGFDRNHVARAIIRDGKAPKLADREEARCVRAFSILQEAASILGVSEGDNPVLETASFILHHAKPFPSRDKELRALVAVALIKAFELHQIPVSQEEVKEALGLEGEEDKLLWKARRLLNERKALRSLPEPARPRDFEAGIGCASLLPRVNMFIHRAVMKLRLPLELKERISMLLVDLLKAGNKSLCGHKPEAVAAAAVYIGARLYGFEVSQKSVAKALGIRDTALRKQQKFLLNGTVLLIEL